ncbi:MAG: hypothetical protein WCC68_08815 [Methanoregula sp.]
MNAKYFGDTRDLFKYDLITSLVKGFRGRIDRIVIVPMLTKYDPNFKGNPGCRNTDLIACFRRLRRTEEVDRYYDELKSYIKELKTDINKKKVRIRIEKSEIFSKQKRDEYFGGIYENFPTAALIFIDPDTGIKEKNFTEKHLSFSELKKFYDQLDDESILMIYQHYQRRRPPAPDEPKRKFADVLTLTGAAPVIIADNTVMFLFLTKNQELYDTLTGILRNYARIEQAAARKKNSERSIDVIVSA